MSQKGHKEADCWMKVSNANKRPAGWKLRKNNSDDDEAIVFKILRYRVL